MYSFSFPVLTQQLTFALSFFRSQNVLGWSKFFVPDQKSVYILWRSQTFCARQKDDLYSVKFVFCARTKVFEEALNAVKFLGLLKKFGSAQNILGPVFTGNRVTPYLKPIFLKMQSSLSSFLLT